MRLEVEHFTRPGVPVRSPAVIDRASADDPIIAAAVTEVNFVHLSGSRPDYLFRTLSGRLV
ncbi:MAG: hypothetical protein JW748_00510 [Anaerolineales bacterium]|nr:hypothetical protein [Anaerolineales bacterium]